MSTSTKTQVKPRGSGFVAKLSSAASQLAAGARATKTCSHVVDFAKKDHRGMAGCVKCRLFCTVAGWKADGYVDKSAGTVAPDPLAAIQRFMEFLETYNCRVRFESDSRDANVTDGVLAEFEEILERADNE